MVKATKKTKKNVKSKTKKKAAKSKITSTSDLQTTIEKVSNESSTSIVHTDLHSSLSDSIFKDSFDKFLGDRCDRRNQLNLKENVRASFNRDSSFECSTISEASDLSVHTVCSTPNFKFNDRPRFSTPAVKAPQYYSSGLFASFTGSERCIPVVQTLRNQSPNLFTSYESSLNGSQELVSKEYLNRASDKFSPTTLHKSENRSKRRKKKPLPKAATETTPQNINNEQSDSPGEDCVVPFTKKGKLNSDALTLSIGSRVDSITKDSSNRNGNYSSTVPGFNANTDYVDKLQSVRDFCVTFLGKSKASITSTPKAEMCADSVKEESQFVRCLRNKRSVNKNSLNFSKYNSTEHFKDYANGTDCSANSICESHEHLSLSSSTSSTPQPIGQSYSNDREHTNSTQSCIDVSSEFSYSLISVEFSELHLHSSNAECEATPSLYYIENPSNYSSDMSSRVKGSGENVSTTQGLPTEKNDTNNIGRFAPFPEHFIELMKISRGIGNETSKAAESSDAEKIEKSDYSNAESVDQRKGSISHINSSEISENYSELCDTQGSRLDCCSKATVELSELSNNSSGVLCSRQGNLSSTSQFSNNKSDNTSVESVTSVSTVEHVKLTSILDSNVSKRTRSGLRKLSNASKSSENVSSQFVHTRKKRKMSAADGRVVATTTLNVTSNKSMNSTVINNSEHFEPSQVESSDAEQIEKSDYSNAESVDQRKGSISHINSSEISENYSELCDTQGNRLDCCSIATVELSELSNNSSGVLCSRQGNLSSDRSDASQFCTEKSDNSSVESVILASNVKLSQIIDSSVSKRTRSGLKKLANESENILTQFVNTRKRQKMLPVDVGVDAANTLNVTSTNDKSTNSTVINNSRNCGACIGDKVSPTFTPVCSEPKIPNPLRTANEKTDFAPRNLMTNESTNRSQPKTDNFQSSCSLGTVPIKKQREVSISGKTTHGSTSALEMQFVSIRRSKNNENEHNKLTTLKTMDTDQVPRELLSDISNKMNSKNVTKRKRKKIANTLNLPAIMESSAVDLPESKNIETTGLTENDAPKLDTDTHSLSLHSGKWRRLLSVYRRHSISMRSAFLLEQTDVESINSLKVSLSNESNRQTLRHSVSFNLSRDNFADFNETSDRRAARRRRASVVNQSVDVGRITEFDFVSTYDARDTILRRCGQSEPLEFAEVYSEGALHQCRKIGEGVYGEVFMNKTDAGRAVVLKVIPIEGSLEVNGEPQKKYDEILSEIVIALQLSSLRNDKEYMTSSFAEVVQVRCVQGRYPNHLIDLWELYRDNYQTENDHPEIFTDDQLYIVFELANGGQDLEAFQFANALQSKSAFQQMALALAIAEKKLQFEHRDLHWGNILLSPTDDKFVNFKFNGNTLQIPSEGIKVTIIDYTLSRILYEGIVLYNDLSNDDELFTAHGDYQFDIYRLMKSNLDNDWQRFEPFNNILWLHYIIDKLINGARYKNTKSRKHRLAIEDLMVIRDEITNYKSAVDSVSNI